MSIFERLKTGLARSRQGLVKKLEAVLQRPQWDEEAFTAVEEILISADVGVRAVQKLLDVVRQAAKNAPGNFPRNLPSLLQEEIIRILKGPEKRTESPSRCSVKPWVIMFVGVNGVGKTTTIGKLASQQRGLGRSVLLVAGDTFRAAAIEQLEIWGRRTGVEVIKHKQGQDPSGVVFDALQAAKKRQVDLVLIDTAGRLHTKVHLLEELRKMKRVLEREQSGAPHETLLVLDATTGQNAFQQAKVFKEALDITGIVLTKLDGTAKGGVVIAIQEELGIPVEHIGLGEDVEDLYPFEPESFGRALFIENWRQG